MLTYCNRSWTLIHFFYFNHQLHNYTNCNENVYTYFKFSDWTTTFLNIKVLLIISGLLNSATREAKKKIFSPVSIWVTWCHSVSDFVQFPAVLNNYQSVIERLSYEQRLWMFEPAHCFHSVQVSFWKFIKRLFRSNK